MKRTSLTGRRSTSMVAGLIALVAMLAALALAGPMESHASGDHTHAAAPTKRVEFHDAMRALWEEHGSWTRMVIVSFVGNLPDLTAAENVLLHNQAKIGDAVKPYYGAAAGNKLTKLLKAHILGAVDLLQAAKSGDLSSERSCVRALYPPHPGNGRHDLRRDHQAVPRPLLGETRRRSRV